MPANSNVTSLDANESVLMLVQMARNCLKDKTDLRSQLADLRLAKAEEAIKGNINMETYEEKILGKKSK